MTTTPSTESTCNCGCTPEQKATSAGQAGPVEGGCNCGPADQQAGAEAQPAAGGCGCGCS